MAFEKYDWIIDGILGVGLSRDLDDKYREIVARINNKNIISIDIPSGIFDFKKMLRININYTGLSYCMYLRSIHVDKQHREHHNCVSFLYMWFGRRHWVQNRLSYIQY